MKPQILFYSNGLAVLQFSRYTQIKVNNGHKSAILNLIKMKFSKAYLSLKQYILL